MKVIFEKEALEEYRDAALYSERHFGLGVEFVRALREATASIAKSPGRFRVVRGEIRIFRMRRFPFHLFYQHTVETDCIIIYAVAHHARRPEYWRSRTDPGK